MRFCSLDVETANYDSASICQIGIGIFENGVLVDTWDSLIDPQDSFHWSNVRVHGITSEMVHGHLRSTRHIRFFENFCQKTLSSIILLLIFRLSGRLTTGLTFVRSTFNGLIPPGSFAIPGNNSPREGTTSPMWQTTWELNSGIMMHWRIQWPPGKLCLRPAG